MSAFRQRSIRPAFLLVLGCVLWSAGAFAAESAPPAASTAAVEARDLLASARRAVAAGRLTAPAGDNAFEYYVATRRLDPAHAGALEGITDLYPLVADAANAAIERGAYAEAARLLALIEAGVPDSRLAPRLRSRLERVGVDVPAPAEASALLAMRTR